MGVTALFPCRNVLSQGLLIRNAAIQTLPLKGTARDVRHGEPTTMLRRRVKVTAVHQRVCFCWFQGVIKRRGMRRMEIVHAKSHPRRMRRMHGEPILYTVGKGDFRAAIRPLPMAPTCKRSERHQEIAYAVALLCMGIARNRTGCGIAGWGRYHTLLVD